MHIEREHFAKHDEEYDFLFLTNAEADLAECILREHGYMVASSNGNIVTICISGISDSNIDINKARAIIKGIKP